MKHTHSTHPGADVAGVTSTAFEPSIPPPMHAVPIRPPLKTFADVDDFIREHPDLAKNRGPLRSICRGVACRVNAILASERNQPFEADAKKLDLATVYFDIKTINGVWKGRSYRAAGFTSKKSFRDSRWAVRYIGRAAGMVVPAVAPPIESGDPFEPLLRTPDKYDRPAIGHFVAWCREAGLLPADVRDAVLIDYRTHVLTHMIGKPADKVIRLIAQLWNSTAQREPTWPRTRLSAPCLLERYTLPFTAYPVSFQNAVAALEAWMAGTKRRNTPGRRPGRKRAVARQLS